MAHRHGRSLLALLIVVVLVACSDDGSAAPTSTTAPRPGVSTTTIIAATSSTTTTSLDSTSTTLTASEKAPTDIDAEIVVPDGEGPFPAVVLVHGGGWVTGAPSVMRPLARHLNASGFLTVNTSYALSSGRSPGYPQAVDDVACAVRIAAAHPESDGTVTLIGHSAGAHISAIVALTGDEYARDCPASGSGLPDRFVGLAGPYDVSRLGLAMQIFFGAGPDEAADIWAAGNPQTLTPANPDLDALIMYGEFDGLVEDRFAFEFFDALESSGATALLELVEGARHNEMHDPDLVGDLIVTWLDR
ncbi:MAG TPA: alpha/beta hydrolase [Acidimicrobiia bacterium]|nr:alpha/beta hydrolase [Acidimicrobiia bacterium]